MKKNINLLLAAIVFLFTTASCLNTEEVDYTGFTDCSLTAFSINNIETKVTTKNSIGEDSTYTRTVAGADYAFTIDHLKREIYNNDSLPLGTNITKVKCEVRSDGRTIYKNNNYDSSKTDSFEWGQSTDSIDFTKPVTFRVMALNGTDYRDYTVRLNVHQSDSSVTVWKKMAGAYPGSELEQPRAVTFGKKVAVYGMKNNKLHVTIADKGQENWSDLTAVQGLTDAVQHTEIATFNGAMYVIDNKVLMRSADGVEWTDQSANTELDHLLGGNSTQLFAVKGGQFLVSGDGMNWEEEESEYPEMIPDHEIFSVFNVTSTNHNIERTIMVGKVAASTDSIAPVWFRQDKEAWTYMHTGMDKSYFLPNLKNLVILYYKEWLFALGGQKLNTPYPGKALDGIYVSLDRGLTWKQQKDDKKFTYPTLPAEIQGNNHPFAAYLDDDLNIWILFSETGEVWRGKFNNMNK